MSEGFQMLNFSLEIAGIVLCGLGILMVYTGSMLEKVMVFFFRFVFTSIGMILLSQFLGDIANGREGFRILNEIATFSEFFVCILVATGATTFLIRRVFGEEERARAKRAEKILVGFLLLQTLLLILFRVTGRYYTIDNRNTFRKGAFYPLYLSLVSAVLFVALLTLLRYGQRLSQRKKASYIVIFFLPLMAGMLQMFFDIMPIVTFSVVVAAMIIYILVVKDQTAAFYEAKQKNRELTVQIMLSQIQPHFLFNSLSTIKEVCHTEPEKAEEAIGEFSSYLRHNMESINVERPIPFLYELTHVRRYVDLERLRFGDSLTVNYVLPVTDFSLPTLTLQPLVENAVRYGVRKTETGEGTVTVRTEEFPDRFEISVADNGPGFDLAELSDENATHIGLKNVRSRVETICGGALLIDSAPGKGARVTIVLPKKDDGKETIGDANAS